MSSNDITQVNFGESSVALDYKLRTNNQGKLTGIELLGYPDGYVSDPVRGDLEGGPGSVCAYDDVLYILTEITNEQTVVEFAGQGLRAEIPTNAMHVYDIDEINAAIRDEMSY